MIIIQPTGDITIDHPSRATSIEGETTLNISIYDKGSRDTITPTAILGTYTDGTLSFTIEDIKFPRSEAGTYYMTVLDSTNSLLFNSNILCTAQSDLQDYEILTEGEDYIEPPQASNNFLTY
jgi:hypothetical protein